MRFFFALFLCLSLTSCSNPFRPFYPDSAELTTRHIAKRGETMAPYPLYCYRTLADTMCYEKPLNVDDQRLTGYYGPMPKQYE